MDTKTPKQTWKESRSALRFLLNHPDITNAVCQYRRIKFRGTSYIYNTFSRNIIATLKYNNKGGVIRYRPTSHYADILERWSELINRDQAARKVKQTKFYVIPSSKLSHMQRRVNRWAQRVEGRTLEYMHRALSRKLNKQLANWLLYDRREMRRQRRSNRDTESVGNAQSSVFYNVYRGQLVQVWMSLTGYKIWFIEDTNMGSESACVIRVEHIGLNQCWDYTETGGWWIPRDYLDFPQACDLFNQITPTPLVPVESVDPRAGGYMYNPASTVTVRTDTPSSANTALNPEIYWEARNSGPGDMIGSDEVTNESDSTTPGPQP